MCCMNECTFNWRMENKYWFQNFWEWSKYTSRSQKAWRHLRMRGGLPENSFVSSQKRNIWLEFPLPVSVQQQRDKHWMKVKKKLVSEQKLVALFKGNLKIIVRCITQNFSTMYVPFCSTRFECCWKVFMFPLNTSLTSFWAMKWFHCVLPTSRDLKFFPLRNIL